MKRILIVGATSGLGRLLAETYRKEGHILGICGRRKMLLDELADGYDNVKSTVLDVMAIETIEEKLKGLIEQMGGLDMLILCSGVGRMNPTLDVSLELPTVDTNVRGWTLVMDVAFNYLMKQGHGQIAAISSFAGIRGLAPAPAYAASKSYQQHYMDSLRQRALGKGIPLYITDIRPGFIRTDLLKAPDKLFWVDSPEVAVKQIYRAIEKKKRRKVVTRKWAFLAVLFRIIPEWLLAKVLTKARL